jgi:hypothetical protein
VGNINCDATGFGITNILMRNNTMLIEEKQLKDIANWMKVEHPAELPEVLQGIFIYGRECFTRRLFDDVQF